MSHPTSETAVTSETADEDVSVKFSRNVGKNKKLSSRLREIQVIDESAIDNLALLKLMRERYENSFKKWKNKSNVFGKAHFAVTISVILIQVSQIILFQIPQISDSIKSSIATVLPAITAAILSIQLKLNWSEKGSECSKAAQLYKQLLHNTEYRLKVIGCGGEFTDSVELWNSALLSECKEVPPFIHVY